MINKFLHGDCFDLIKTLPPIDVVVTSPPYAEQRKYQYDSVSEKSYAYWTVMWMAEIKQILKPRGSVFINIRPHIKNGEISDYVLRTRLALREDGWKECEEIIWYKPDSPPLGSVNRPRRAWESILWFSLSNNPYCNPKANGTISERIGFENKKFDHGGTSHIHAGQNDAMQGISRCRDVIVCGTGRIEKGIKHEAMFPKEIPDYCIKLACPDGGTVLDNFMGSGTTALAAIENNVNYIGIEKELKHVQLSKSRIAYVQPAINF